MIGQRVRRREDPRFITGHGRYVDDFAFPDAQHLVFVRSDWAHARLIDVDVSAAAQLDGVTAFTAAELDLNPIEVPWADARFGRPYLASDRVRFVGEIVAVVVAGSREQAVDAAELVGVECDPLPVLIDPEHALKDETLLFEDVATNVISRQTPDDADPQLLDGCDVVITGSNLSQRVAVAPIEPRCCVAVPEPDGAITLYSSTQSPHQDRDDLATALGVAAEQARVVAPDVGGGFGGKALNVEHVLVAWAARRIGAPVRWTETRSESMLGIGHGRGQRAEFELGGDRDGNVRALRVHFLQEAGAYPWVGAALPELTSLMSSGVYAIPRIETSFTTVVTNTVPTGAYRGAGRPEATQFLERAMDQYAAEIGLDPAEVRRRNLIAADAFPYTTPTGATYDCGDYPQALALALEAAGYEDLRAEQATRRERGDTTLLGIGLAVYVEVTNGGPESEFGEVEITPEGDAILRTGSFSHGQGHETTFAQIVAAQLGLPIDRVTVLKGDTAVIARGTGTYGSKSTQIGGAAAQAAAGEVLERGKRLAAEQLEADPHDMRLDADRGVLHVAGAPEPALAWSALAQALHQAGRLDELTAQNDFAPPEPTFPFGAHVAVVEVDSETGKVALRRLITVDDAGRIINPTIADGQIHGGVASGIAQAIHEEMVYDEDGNPVNGNFVTYCIPSASEFPQFELVRMETPTPINPLGAKGIGESGTIGSTPAVHNAVLDALAPFGVRHLDMPVNGEKVWRAIADATAARA